MYVICRTCHLSIHVFKETQKLKDFFLPSRGRKYFSIIIEWEIQGFVFHAVLFAVILARARFKLVSDIHDCVFLIYSF